MSGKVSFCGTDKMKEKSLGQFLKYCIVGASNVVVNQAIYAIIVFCGGNYLFASLMGFLVSVLNAYYWSNRYVFKEEEGTEKRVWWKVLLKTYAAYAWGFIVNAVLLVMWVDIVKLSRFLNPVAEFFAGFGWDKLDAALLGELLASVLNVIVTIPMNFVLNKYWAYQQTKVVIKEVDGQAHSKADTIYLRPMTMEDTENIIRWRNSDAVRKRFIYQKPFTKESHENWIKTMIDTGEAVQMIICLKEGDVPVGSVYIRDIDTIHHKGEYGIFIGEESARGKGVGTAAARQMIEYAFKELKLHRLFLRVFADNEQAIKSYKKAGFRKEAYLKDDVCIAGKYCDIVLMAVINE